VEAARRDGAARADPEDRAAGARGERDAAEHLRDIVGVTVTLIERSRRK